MKNFFLLLFLLFLIFLGLTYWSVSIGPEEVKLSEVVLSTGNPRESDSVRVITSNQYESNAIKRFMQGRNYRDAWEVPVKVPVFKLDSMEILKKGGGMQTRSLKLKSPSGVHYSLRSINKYPQPLIPKAAKVLKLENIVIDGVSAQHPYGALLAAQLSDHAEVLHTHPRAVYVPEQPGLGRYNKKFGNKLYLLEYETEGDVNWTPLKDVVGIFETEDLQDLKVEHDNKVRIDERAFVRARLFDLLIGDWDRHAKQWGWVVREDDSIYTAVPLAGDRDNSFFRLDGIIPTILTNELLQPMLRPFEGDIDFIQGYVYPVDLYFLRNTPRHIFTEEAEALQTLLSDDKIKTAFKAWPPEMRKLNAEEIFQKLQKRRNNLKKYAVEFYEEINSRELTGKPLKGSEDKKLPKNLQKCFSCEEN